MKILLIGIITIVAFFPFMFGWIILALILSIIFIPLVIPNKYFLPKSRQ